jgi:hypothetical protein
MRSFALGVLLLGLAVPTLAARKGWTPERRNLQTRTCIDAYWDVHPEVTRTPAYLRQVENYCVCVTDEWSERGGLRRRGEGPRALRRDRGHLPDAGRVEMTILLGIEIRWL